MFSPPAASVRKGLEGEAKRISTFWDKEVVVEVEEY
jgi:hypothetical protein